jgi:guanyl-specific ribonuclease Sa
MRVIRRQLKLAALACCVLVPIQQPSFSQEDHLVRRVEPRRNVESDERRREHENRADEKPVTMIEEVRRNRDLTKEQNPEFLDADKLSKAIDADKNRQSSDIKSKVEVTLERITKGERDLHINDGSVFENRKEPLPPHELGYYKEYVYRPEGAKTPGMERVIVGRGGEVYYTPDHYDTFERVK